MKNQKGFVWLPILLVILGLAVIGGGAYYFTHEQSGAAQMPIYQPQTTTQPTTQATVNTATKNTAPSISVTGWHSDGPATITVSYSNLPARTSALAVCIATTEACTEWVENFKPTSPNGTYTMSAQNAFGAGSQKGLASATYKIVVIGSGFSDHITTSNSFTVVSGQTTTNSPPQTSTNSGINFAATPTSGTAPLTVILSAHGNLLYGNLKIEFGDGTQDTNSADFISTDNYGNQTLHSSHTYTSPGTYMVGLLGQECTGAPTPTCGSFSSVGTATITVTQ